MPTIRLEPALWPGTQQRFFKEVMNNRVARKFMFCAAAQVGKNFVGKWAFMARLIERIQSGVPGEAWILAPDYDLTARAREDFKEVLPKELLLDYHEESKGPSWYKLLGNVVVFIRSASDPEKIRSKTLFLVLFDELSKVCETAYLNTLLRLEVEDGTLIATTTPCNSESPWLDELHDKFQNDKDFAWFHCGIEENRLMKPDRIRKLREQFPDDYGLEQLEGKFIKSRTGLVYKCWNGGLQIIESYTPQDDDEIIAGGDGGIGHPFAWSRIAFSKNGLVTLFEEECERDLAASDQVALIKRSPYEARVKRRWVDPSASYLEAELRKGGLKTLHAKNDVDQGILRTYALIAARDEKGAPIFRVVRSCKNFIKEVGLYRYRKQGTAYASDKVVKLHDDLLDSVRYVVYSENRVPGVVGIRTEKDLQPKEKNKEPYLDEEALKQGRYVLTGFTQDLSGRKSEPEFRSWAS